MDLRLIYAIILSAIPVSELRGGMPLAILFARDNNVPIALVISLIIMINILAAFFAFYFLDNLHEIFIKWKPYQRIFNSYLNKLQKKANNFEKKYKSAGFLALLVFVAVPLPGTGAWTACLLAWLLSLNRKKSMLAIALGVIGAGIIMSLGTLGVIAFS
jgi:uncharacterized membrane protein